jgi:hypothetical protein
MAQVNLVTNIGLDATATGGLTGLVHEPTACAFYDRLLMTGNWFASSSTDGGNTWTLISPYSALPPAAGGFCCDQVTVHERSRNLFLWVLQYNRGADGTNVFRLAVSTSGSPGPWFWWDFSPPAVNASWGNLWFDLPHMATSNTNVYITFNMYDQATPRANWVQAVVFKMPLQSIIDRNLTYEYYVIDTHGSLRLTPGATTDMFFASHRGGNPIRVFQWPDDPSGRLSAFDVSARPWIGGQPGTYSSLAPDGQNWLGRIDHRMNSAWVVGSQVGFLWTANPSSGRPQPYVKALVVDTSSQSVVYEPDIWDNNVAWAYPAACPNVNGTVGLSLFYGGGNNYPTHCVGFWDTSGWTLTATVASTNGPVDNTWGDYLWCATQDPDGTDWVASGYSLQGGNTRASIVPQFVQFSAVP